MLNREPDVDLETARIQRAILLLDARAGRDRDETALRQCAISAKLDEEAHPKPSSIVGVPWPAWADAIRSWKGQLSADDGYQWHEIVFQLLSSAVSKPTQLCTLRVYDSERLSEKSPGYVVRIRLPDADNANDTRDVWFHAESAPESPENEARAVKEAERYADEIWGIRTALTTARGADELLARYANCEGLH